MSSAPLAERTRASAEPLEIRYLWALASLDRRLLRTGWLARAGRSYAWAVAFGTAALIFFVSREEPERVAELVTRALVPLSWSAGVVGWAAARDLDGEAQTSNLFALAAARGATARDVNIARLIATIYVVTSTVGLPLVFLAAVAALRAPSFADTARLVVGLGVYAMLFGAVLGGLARLSSRVAPRYGRTLFALMVLGPLALGDALIGAPGVVGFLSSLIDLVSRLAGPK